MAHGRAGLYAWGGPGTVRLLQTKYFSPLIDEQSFLTLYDLETLKRFSERLDLTDIWTTFSWGFNDANETIDREFITSRLKNFHALELRAHAYIQGWNLVTADFPDAEFWAVDGNNQRMAYSKGRHFTCVNHPEFQKLFLNRVKAAAKEEFGGVFIDNIMFGLPPLFVRSDFLPACGCRCEHCSQAFQKRYGYELPRFEITGKQQVNDFVRFRCDSTFSLLEKAANFTQKAKKEFGVNLYDPLHHTPELFYGYELSKVADLVDYLLVENHGLPITTTRNEYLFPLLKLTRKPVFVVSYKEGIGFEPAYSPEDYATIEEESMELGYHPCYKGTEFTTEGIWHALRPDQLPSKVTQARLLEPVVVPEKQKLKSTTPTDRVLAYLSRYTAPLMSLANEHTLVGRAVFSLGLAKNILHSVRNYAYELPSISKKK